MNTERIKQIQLQTAYPDSISVKIALLKVWNECEQNKTSESSIGGRSEPTSIVHHCGNELTEKEILYDHCLKCHEYLSED